MDKAKNAPCSQDCPKWRSHEMSQNKSPMLSASSGLQLSWTLCLVTWAALDKAPTILLCFVVTLYYFYMLWWKGLEEAVRDFWKYLLDIGRRWSRTLLCFACWLSTDDLPQWQESKFSTFVEALHRAFCWLIPSSEAKNGWSRDIWVSFQSWDDISGWHIRVESTGGLGKHYIWVQLLTTASSI